YSAGTNSDTQIVTKAIANLGEKKYIEVLQRYNGVMSLLFFSPKFPNSLLVYKDPERPLFGWHKSASELYISSIKESFESLDASESDIFSFKDGYLHHIQSGKIIQENEIKRD